MSNRYIFGIPADEYFPLGGAPVPEFSDAVDTDEKAAWITEHLFRAAKEMLSIEHGRRPHVMDEAIIQHKDSSRVIDFLFSTEDDGFNRIKVEAEFNPVSREVSILAVSGDMRGDISVYIPWSVEVQNFINWINTANPECGGMKNVNRSLDYRFRRC